MCEKIDLVIIIITETIYISPNGRKVRKQRRLATQSDAERIRHTKQMSFIPLTAVVQLISPALSTDVAR